MPISAKISHIDFKEIIYFHYSKEIKNECVDIILDLIYVAPLDIAKEVQKVLKANRVSEVKAV